MTASSPGSGSPPLFWIASVSCLVGPSLPLFVGVSQGSAVGPYSSPSKYGGDYKLHAVDSQIPLSTLDWSPFIQTKMSEFLSKL